MLAFQGRMLKRAAEICGGYKALAERFGVSEFRLKAWVEARAALPSQVFLKAADIVLEDDIARAAQDRRINPRIPANDPLRETEAGHA